MSKVAGTPRTKELKSERVPFKMKLLHGNVHSMEAIAHPTISP